MSMPRKTIRILAVGRLKTPFWKEAADYYLRRLTHWFNVQEDNIPDAQASLTPIERQAKDSLRIIKALTAKDLPVCMDERGISYSSPDFAKLLEKLCEDSNRIPCFILGGPFGLTDSVRKKTHHIIALGPQTLPHELVRVVLLEQIYRAETIRRNLPYHH